MNEEKFHINFLDYPTSNSNDKSQFENYFKKHNPEEWKAGSGGGSFIFQDNDKEFSIVILEDNKYGFSLFYDCPDGCFYSLGNPELLSTFHTNDDEIELPIGTYISIDKAWLAIQDFLDKLSKKSHRIEWIHVDNIEWID